MNGRKWFPANIYWTSKFFDFQLKYFEEIFGSKINFSSIYFRINKVKLTGRLEASISNRKSIFLMNDETVNFRFVCGFFQRKKYQKYLSKSTKNIKYIKPFTGKAWMFLNLYSLFVCIILWFYFFLYETFYDDEEMIGRGLLREKLDFLDWLTWGLGLKVFAMS